MNLPTLEAGKFILMHVQASTGIILNNDNSYYLNSGTHYFTVFDSLNGIKDYIARDKASASQGIEYVIYNHLGGFVEMIT